MGFYPPSQTKKIEINGSVHFSKLQRLVPKSMIWGHSITKPWKNGLAGVKCIRWMSYVGWTMVGWFLFSCLKWAYFLETVYRSHVCFLTHSDRKVGQLYFCDPGEWGYTKYRLYVKSISNRTWTSPTWAQVEWGEIEVQRGVAELDFNLTEFDLSGVARGDPPKTPTKSNEVKSKSNEPSWTWPNWTWSEIAQGEPMLTLLKSKSAELDLDSDEVALSWSCNSSAMLTSQHCSKVNRGSPSAISVHC